jgi:hypothetical protein
MHAVAKSVTCHNTCLQTFSETIRYVGETVNSAVFCLIGSKVGSTPIVTRVRLRGWPGGGVVSTSGGGKGEWFARHHSKLAGLNCQEVASTLFGTSYSRDVQHDLVHFKRQSIPRCEVRTASIESAVF